MKRIFVKTVIAIGGIPLMIRNSGVVRIFRKILQVWIRWWWWWSNAGVNVGSIRPRILIKGNIRQSTRSDELYGSIPEMANLRHSLVYPFGSDHPLAIAASGSLAEHTRMVYPLVRGIDLQPIHDMSLYVDG
jgi:hypothetical protein